MRKEIRKDGLAVIDGLTIVCFANSIRVDSFMAVMAPQTKVANPAGRLIKSVHNGF